MSQVLLPSLRARSVPSFKVMQMLARARALEAEGRSVLHLEVGQPSAGAPAGAVEAAVAAARGPAAGAGYTQSAGLPQLRSRVAQHYSERYGAQVEKEAVAITTGSSAGFVLAFLAAFEPGQKVALATPGYPCYRSILETVGVEPVPIPVGPETNFQPTVAMLDQAEREVGQISGVCVASPSNPTGTVVSKAELAALSGWCRGRGAWLVSDEIYHRVEYGAPVGGRVTTSAAELPCWRDHAIILNSFSKYYCMTGYRIGWAVVPEPLRDAWDALAQHLFICPPAVSQHAALAAFDCDAELQGHVDRYARNREVLLEGLPKAGFGELSRAEGAFYVYADVSGLTDDSEALCNRILEETGVACTSGADFDRERGSGYVRFSFCGDGDEVREAMRRLQNTHGWRA